MTFTDAVRTCFRKYFTFSGRASRPEYWWFVLFLFLGGLVAGVIDSALFGEGLSETEIIDQETFATYDTTGPFAALFSLVTLIPSISAGWRRMHDTGRSGLYLLYPLIVMIGIGLALGLLMSIGEIGGIILGLAVIVLLISPLLVLWWLTRPSEPGDNKYGPNPRDVRAVEAR